MRYLIKNAKVIDGVSDYIQNIDVYIIEDKIKLEYFGEVDEIVDAKGMILCPGFIDIHRHGDLVPFFDKPCYIDIMQGITTSIDGQCGFSAFPRNDKTEEFAKSLLGEFPNVKFENISEFYDVLENCDLTNKRGHLVGSGSVRSYYHGSKISLSDEEFNEILGGIKDAIHNGALGISMGLMYSPERYYSHNHIVEIFKLGKELNVPLCMHMRGEGGSLLKSLEEVLNCQKESGCQLHVSHLKSAGKSNWGENVDKALSMIKNQKLAGYNISYDCYPYNAGSTFLTALLPSYALEGGIDSLLNKVDDENFRLKLEKDYQEDWSDKDNLIKSTTFENVMIISSSDPLAIGKSIATIARERGVEDVDVVCELINKDKGKTVHAFFNMSQDDVDKIICSKECIVISDALYNNVNSAHPRLYGAFSKYICDYIKTEKINLCEGIRKITSMPAKVFGLKNVGSILDGYCADVLLFNLDDISNNSTFVKSNVLSSGIYHMFIDGKQCIKEGKIVCNNAGKAIKRR